MGPVIADVGNHGRVDAANGIRSSLSMPLRADGVQGAMNLYALVPGAFGEPEVRRAELFAASVSAALALAARQASAAELTDQMREALASRAAIDQALGVIMAQGSRAVVDGPEQLFTDLVGVGDADLCGQRDGRVGRDPIHWPIRWAQIQRHRFPPETTNQQGGPRLRTRQRVGQNRCC